MKNRTIHGQFAAQAAATPGAAAVACSGNDASYAELARRARALAHRLRGVGVGPEALVAVLVERSVDLPVALLGILAAGGAYLLLDPTNPPGRLAQLLAGARPAAILAERSLAGRLPPRRAHLVLLEDAPADEDTPASPETPATPATGAGGGGDADGSDGAFSTENDGGLPQVAAEGLAYVLPAGAGGAPPAARVSHAEVIDYFAALDRHFGAGVAGSWLAVIDLSSDVSVLELLWALGRGARVALCAARELAPTAAAATSAAPRALDFSLFYFGNYAAGRAADHYRLVLEGARFADHHGFRAIWTPERHFHEFGGLFPNPAVLAAAIAVRTERLQIRAGSVVLPLHDPLRVAEEWALVDNLSAGRAGVSFASGWHANDFVLKPGAYEDRHEIMRQGIDTVRRLWRGEALRLPGGTGHEVEVRIFPRPVQAELPVWVTAAGSPETFRLAGELGAGVLTHLLGQDAAEFGAKIEVYRQAWREAGHGPGRGQVTVMLHTFVGPSLEAVHAVVREPLSSYLKTSFGLLRSLAASVGLDRDPRQLAPAELDLLVSRAYERYVADGAGLIGTPETCAATLDRLQRLGVDEVACLIDFGVAADEVLASLPHLEELRRRGALGAAPARCGDALAARLSRQGVTHLHCTPSLARRLEADAGAAANLGGLRELLAGKASLPLARSREAPLPAHHQARSMISVGAGHRHPGTGQGL
jgi:natural product biosynthesis luciferase-like monooxygenase protein